MPVKSIQWDGENLSVQIMGLGEFSFDPGKLPAHLRNRVWSDPERRVAAEQYIQSLLDQRIPLTDLPEDDPARMVDPDRPDWFHDGGDLVGRPVTFKFRQSETGSWKPTFLKTPRKR